MSEQGGGDFERMSHEEIADLAKAIGEFHSTHPCRVLSQIAGLEIEEKWVEVRLTKRKPPVEIASNAEIIPIDECLGLYQPRAKRITLFQRGIAAAADLLRRATEDLQRVTVDLEHVVRYHEWGHAIVHVGLDKGRHQCELGDYNRTDERVHESIAQLLAWQAIEENIRKSESHQAKATRNRIKDIFIRLEHRQTPKYRNWRQFEKLPKPCLQKVLILIRTGTRFGDWEGLSVLGHECSGDGRTM